LLGIELPAQTEQRYGLVTITENTSIGQKFGILVYLKTCTDTLIWLNMFQKPNISLESWQKNYKEKFDFR
jgi:hypothetical protein